MGWGWRERGYGERWGVVGERGCIGKTRKGRRCGEWPIRNKNRGGGGGGRGGGNKPRRLGTNPFFYGPCKACGKALRLLFALSPFPALRSLLILVGVNFISVVNDGYRNNCYIVEDSD